MRVGAAMRPSSAQTSGAGAGAGWVEEDEVGAVALEDGAAEEVERGGLDAWRFGSLVAASAVLRGVGDLDRGDVGEGGRAGGRRGRHRRRDPRRETCSERLRFGCGQGDELRDEEAVDLEEGCAGNPVGEASRRDRRRSGDGVVQAAAPQVGPGRGASAAAAALAGGGWAGARCLRRRGRGSACGARRRRHEGGDDLIGQGAGVGAEGEGEVEARLVGGGEELELVGDVCGRAARSRPVGRRGRGRLRRCARGWARRWGTG